MATLEREAPKKPTTSRQVCRLRQFCTQFSLLNVGVVNTATTMLK